MGSGQNLGAYEVSLLEGRVVVLLADPKEPFDRLLREQIDQAVTAIFKVRQLQSHREFELAGPTIHNDYGNGSKTFGIQADALIAVAAAVAADVIVEDSSGRVLADTRAERIAAEKGLIDAVVPKVALSTPLRSMLESYSNAVSDPANELVHLYEIRDALGEHYGRENKAQAALGISKNEWQVIGRLADAEPVKEGRHRGKHHDRLRPATPEELESARVIVREWIVRFAATV